MSNTPGIKKLLDAEKAAAEKVKAARNRKALRLKQAKEEAASELKSLQDAKEEEFKKKQDSNSGDKSAITENIDKKTKEDIVKIDQTVTGNKEEVITELLDIVCKVDPVLHINYETRQKTQKN